jgi:hydrogenase maturation protease
VIAGLDAAILVAAIHSGAPPGTIHVLNGEELAALEPISRKGGGWGTAQTLSLGYQLAPEDLPERLLLIGIEGTAFGLGEGLSPAVQAAIPEALQVLDQTLKDLTRKTNAFWQLIKKIRKFFPGFSGE